MGEKKDGVRVRRSRGMDVKDLLLFPIQVSNLCLVETKYVHEIMADFGVEVYQTGKHNRYKLGDVLKVRNEIRSRLTTYGRFLSKYGTTENE